MNMIEPVVHATFTIERTFAASPARVFAAFSNPATKRRWFADGFGMEVQEFNLDFRVGGRESSRLAPKDGKPFANDTVYQDIVPDQRIVCAYTMSREGRRFSASLATFELAPDGDGTKLTFTEQAAFLGESDGPEQRKKGWNQLLEQLAKVLKD
jgi:uncharacterized protein YndB with AHSA1/START domain